MKKKMFAKAAERMAREASVSVPYHKLKWRTLEEFLNRRTVQNRLEFPVDGRQSLAAAIRMPPEQLEAFAKYLEEREKETIELQRQEVPVSEPKATTTLPAIDTEPIESLGVTDTEPDELPNTFVPIHLACCSVVLPTDGGRSEAETRMETAGRLCRQRNFDALESNGRRSQGGSIFS
ncbi:uncharacterized protein LOC120430071 isoform X2 [Culex pipiens pallens]|uniref:uncharacterized protein LOC120430071 isoform X2 n=1 Tax=Culex pipiens pallens TaxID=42434 RepID=UPI001954C83C|nr:uncharacterized protein LOC120430071 isoform X2 [Culex pipiens pallens]